MSEQDADMEGSGLGNIDKGASYRYKKVINNNINSDLNHPIKHGVIMQAHHLISELAIKKSKIGAFLIANGYEINCLENLVYIPSTLEGACHLSTQLHRGDHTTSLYDDTDSDADHPFGYHDFVSQLLKAAEKKIEACELSASDRVKAVEEKMNKVSMKILNKINSFQVPLTAIHKSFVNAADAGGCKNSNSIDKHKESNHNCHKNRDHYLQKHRFGGGTAVSTIELPKTEYTLRQGK